MKIADGTNHKPSYLGAAVNWMLIVAVMAAGVALVEAAGGLVRSVEGEPLTFNKKDPWLTGLLATGEPLMERSLATIRPHESVWRVPLRR